MLELWKPSDWEEKRGDKNRAEVEKEEFERETRYHPSVLNCALISTEGENWVTRTAKGK